MKKVEKIESIIKGWSNYLFDEVKANDDVIVFRAYQCYECESLKNGHFEAVLPDYALSQVKGTYCGICYCPISTKIRSNIEKCPKGKW